jgi:hypothetical protein
LKKPEHTNPHTSGYAKTELFFAVCQGQWPMDFEQHTGYLPASPTRRLQTQMTPRFYRRRRL